MKSFNVTAEDLNATAFGSRVLDITAFLSLPTPIIKGSEMTQLHKKDAVVINFHQPGRETKPKTEPINFKVFHTDQRRGTEIALQQLVARLCGRHSSELKDHYAYIFGRRDERGRPIEITEEYKDPLRDHLVDLEFLVRALNINLRNEIFRNDEQCAMLATKDKERLELEEKIKAMEEKFEAQAKKQKSQESRIQARNKDIRDLNEKIGNYELFLEVDQDLIERLRSEKRKLQGKVDDLLQEVDDYKKAFAEHGLAVEEEEVEMQE